MDKFSEIIGQDIIVSHLQNALRTGGVSHAYILNGAKGSGRHMIARSFSATLLCENPRQEGDLLEPCGECLSCIQAAAGSNPDIIAVEHEKENSIGVGDIRKMRADVKIKPYSAAHKVYILPDAEKMTPAAQNALLKTLEEPPSYAVIFLLADGTSAFLPTIMSRCVTLPLRPVSEKAVEDCLRERFGAQEDRARLCARFSGGSIGRAALLLENEHFAALREKTILLLQKIDKTDAAQLASFAKEAVEEEETQDLIDLILTWNRDLLVCRATHRTENLIFTDEVQYIIEAAHTVSWQGLQAASEAVFRARRRLFSNVNAELTLQMMLLEIRGAYQI
jgi:DNA polymerase-3 subunit delta'